MRYIREKRKNTMKKLLGLAAVLVALTLTFTGCPGQVPDVTDPTVTPTDDTPPVTPPEETNQDNTFVLPDDASKLLRVAAKEAGTPTKDVYIETEDCVFLSNSNGDVIIVNTQEKSYEGYAVFTFTSDGKLVAKVDTGNFSCYLVRLRLPLPVPVLLNKACYYICSKHDYDSFLVSKDIYDGTSNYYYLADFIFNETFALDEKFFYYSECIDVGECEDLGYNDPTGFFYSKDLIKTYDMSKTVAKYTGNYNEEWQHQFGDGYGVYLPKEALPEWSDGFREYYTNNVTAEYGTVEFYTQATEALMSMSTFNGKFEFFKNWYAFAQARQQQ